VSVGNEWINAAKSRDICEVAAALGLEVGRRGAIGPCPACGNARRGKGDRRLAIVSIGLGWHCYADGCGAKGDVVDLVSFLVLGKPSSEADREGWRALKTWFAGEGGRMVASPAGPPPPNYPPVSEVAALWESCLRLDGPGGVRRWPALHWIDRRALDDRLVAALDLARVAEEDTDGGALRLPGWPWCLLLPLVDSTGLLRSVCCRAVVDPPPDMPVKSRALAGYQTGGLVLADPMAMALLSRRPGVAVSTGGVSWSGVVHIVEGEPDYLTLASHQKRVSDGLTTYAVLGWRGSNGLPEDVAARIPESAEVHIWPHQDKNGAGERAADLTIHRLPVNVTVKKRRSKHE